MRLMRGLRDQRDALEASQAAEARAAAAAERGRLAREMHDVLAHSLSALALQLESTRLLARDRGVDAGRDRARSTRPTTSPPSGLEEARRAIAAARGDELPGPERLGALADGVRGAERTAGRRSRCAASRASSPPTRAWPIYRTAQEALTNVRRHATAERVEVRARLPADEHRARRRGPRRRRRAATGRARSRWPAAATG